jgi:cell division protease FtsH
LLEKIAVLLGGRASEKLFFKSVSTGASDDLVKATEMARAMVTQYAMTEKLGNVTFEQKRLPFMPTDFQTAPVANYSEETAQDIDHEVKSILDHAFEIATQAIQKNQTFIEKSVSHLLETETLEDEQIADLWQKFRDSSGTHQRLAGP